MDEIASIVSRVANETYGHSRRIMPEQPWWDNLEPSFHKFPDDFYLDLRTQMMVDATAGVDLLLRTGMATTVAALALPLSLNPLRLLEDNAERSFYQSLAEQGFSLEEFSPGGGLDGSTVGAPDDEVLIEALIVPDESFGGYPALRIFSAASAVNPKNGEAQEMSISADQIYVVDEAAEGPLVQPTLVIERVELVYYMPEPRYQIGELSPDQRYLQPAWMFTGHYSDGTAFFVLVQALQQEFLLPEQMPFQGPG